VWMAAQWIVLVSPGEAFGLVSGAANGAGAEPVRYWQSLVASNGVGWICLGLSSYMLKRTWMADGSSGIRHWFWQKMAINRKPRPLTDADNPVAWLLSGPTLLSKIVWGITIVWSSIVAIILIFADQGTGNSVLASGGLLIDFLIKLIAAFVACRFFMESRQCGALELILCTPLKQLDILDGQFEAFRKTFLAPCLILWGVTFVGLSLTNYEPGPVIGFGALYGLVLAFAMTTINQTGMRLALRLKKAQMAPGLTILMTVIGPTVLCFTCCLPFILLVVVYAWAQTGLSNDWREYLIPGGNRPKWRPQGWGSPPKISSTPNKNN